MPASSASTTPTRSRSRSRPQPPSALEPFGGANTGTGASSATSSVCRPPIAATDVLCFAPLDMAKADVGGTSTPGASPGASSRASRTMVTRWASRRSAARSSMTRAMSPIPSSTVAASGLHPRGPTAPIHSLATASWPGERTGRDGLHGATCSSAELTHETGAPWASCRLAIRSRRRPCSTRSCGRATNIPQSPTAAQALLLRQPGESGEDVGRCRPA